MTLISLFLESSLFNTIILLLVLRILTSLYLATRISSSWVLFTLILVYAGGVIFLFIYITSLLTEFQPITTPENLWSLIRVRVLLIRVKYLTAPRLSKNNEYRISSLYAEGVTPGLVFLGGYLLVLLFNSIKLVLAEKGPLKT